MKIKSTILIFMISSSLFALENKEINHFNSFWFSDFTKWNINNKWSLYLDIGLRGNKWVKEWSQQLIRPGLFYQCNSKLNIGGGLAYFKHFSKNNNRNEYRFWQQLLLNHTIGRIKIANRFRLEQRCIQKIIDNKLSNNYSFINRLRYQLALQIPLNSKKLENKTIYAAVSDEIMFNYGKEIVYNYFDQNRFSFGLGYKYNEPLNIVLSYTTIILHKNKPNTFDNTNVILVSVYHNLNNN